MTDVQAPVGDRTVGHDAAPRPRQPVVRDPSPADPVGRLVAGMIASPQGQVSASVYETGRLVSGAPWLVGHADRIAWLVAGQHPDGTWGAPDGYHLVPTLSATEALLAVLTAPAPTGGPATAAGPAATGGPATTTTAAAAIASAVDRALAALTERRGWPSGGVLPDLPAADLTVPDLTERINAHLDGLPGRPVPGLERWCGPTRVDLPAGMSPRRLAAVRAVFGAGTAVPVKLLHALETIGPAARRAAGVRPEPPGTVGASPAATAAWLGGPDGDPAAVAYLGEVARAGAVPCTIPIEVFERAWVVADLCRAGLSDRVPAELVDGLAGALGPAGACAGPGLPADADTTSVLLHALALAGRPVPPDSLRGFDLGDHFCTWAGEDGSSVTTNAHVLDALGPHAAPVQAQSASDSPPTTLDRTATGSDRSAAGSDRIGNGSDRTARSCDRTGDGWAGSAVRRLSGWLLRQQRPDGTWTDRWHASPYYATACVVLALARYGEADGIHAALDRAVDRVSAGQRPDGSWGRWSGTAEETAYALQVLASAGSGRPDVAAVIRIGRSYLATAAEHAPGPALWHDKDLYHPIAIVRAAVIAALHVTRDFAVDKASTAPIGPE
ncbi:prenyltransferase [Plantactinospora sp. KBS50]|uniref:prenyltransferase n=1 Tax=Plantactinospora sp. KBS50 TaxID=2024580 RepID=UPI000BAAF82D|nr:prenyltransferase [Plantactinospora sp. KBS50]ASW55901.1 hypothetical protein CIK06_19555 [Plantactinospora sp. KBS50]